MKIEEFLSARYGNAAGCAIERKIADKLGIPYPAKKGWFSRHKDREIPRWLLSELKAIPKGGKRSKQAKLAVPKKYREAKPSGDFYSSRQWLKLRYLVLKTHGAKCQCCGASRADGEVMHVDHIKPRSKFPELALSIDNLQILCASCNIGKSNKDDTDWRDFDSDSLGQCSSGLAMSDERMGK